MRKYYLFLIKEEYLYEPDYLIYKIMDNLYHLKDTNLNYGVSCYNQLCDSFDATLIAQYLINKFEGLIACPHKHQYIVRLRKERCLIKLSLKFIIVVTNRNIPLILKYLNCYNKKIFVCDFENHDYFWLHKYYSNSHNKSYI